MRKGTEGVAVLGLEFTYFGAPGVQTAEQSVPSSTNRSAAALGCFSRNSEFVFHVSSFTECKAEQAREVVFVCVPSATAQKHRHQCPNLPEPAHQPTQIQCRHISWCLRDPRASLPSLTQSELTSRSRGEENPGFISAAGMGMVHEAGTGQGAGCQCQEDDGAAQLLQ